jgi:hypothetical protein
MPKIRGIKPDYWTDEDIVDLSIPARLLFIGLWSYACDNGHLQDKPKQIKMRVLPGDDVNATELLRELEDGGRIHRSNGWITVPNFAKHQKPDKRYFQTCDAPGCARPGEDSQPETRGGHYETTPRAPRGPDVVSQGPHVDGDGEVRVRGDEGDGEGEKSRELALAEAPRSDVSRLCDHLASRIEANGAKRPAVTGKWRDAARLMLDKDGRTEHEIHGAIDWCQDDEFWRSNILSLPKLREQYERLRLQAQRKAAPTRKNDIDWDAAFARAEALDQQRGEIA